MSKQKNNFIYQQIVWLKYVFCHCLKDLINFHLSIVKSVIITNCNIPKMKMLHFHFQLFVFYQVKNTLNNTFCWKDNTYDIKWMNCHISSFFFFVSSECKYKILHSMRYISVSFDPYCFATQYFRCNYWLFVSLKRYSNSTIAPQLTAERGQKYWEVSFWLHFIVI